MGHFAGAGIQQSEQNCDRNADSASLFTCQFAAQGDVWEFYREPSMFGREVETLGGPRGPSTSYFVPYLSALQIFTPIDQVGIVHEFFECSTFRNH